MYAALRDSLPSSPHYHHPKDSPINLRQNGQRIALLPRPATYDSRLQKQGLTTQEAKSAARPLSVGGDNKDDNTKLPKLHLHTSMKSNDNLNRATSASEIEITADQSQKRKQTYFQKLVSLNHCSTPGTPLRISQRQSTFPVSKNSEDGNVLKNQSDTEWDLLDKELHLKRKNKHYFSNKPLLQHVFASSFDLPSFANDQLCRGGSVDELIVVGRDCSKQPVFVKTQTKPISAPSKRGQKTESSVLNSTTTNSSSPSLKQDGEVTVMEGEPDHCWACKMEEQTDEPSDAPVDGVPSRYNVHACGKQHLAESLSLSSNQDHSSENDEYPDQILTLDNIIASAKSFSRSENKPSVFSQYKLEKDCGNNRKPLLTPEFTKSLLDSDDDGGGRIKGEPPVSVDYTSDEDEAKMPKQAAHNRRQIFGKHFRPKLERKPTLASTDDEPDVRNGPPAELDEDSDKELEYLAKRNAKMYYPSNQSSYDMADVNLHLVHQSSFNSSFSLPLSTIASRRLGNIGLQPAGSLLGSLASDDGDCF